jgi:hypothetical protein
MQTAPKMGRAQFDYLADMFGEVVAWPSTLEYIADRLEETNPRFNREKFIKRSTVKWEESHDLSELDDEIPY